MRIFIRITRAAIFKDDNWYLEIVEDVFDYKAGDIFGDEIFNSRELAERYLETHII